MPLKGLLVELVGRLEPHGVFALGEVLGGGDVDVGPSEARAIRLLAVELLALLEDHGARVADHDQLRAELGHLALAHALEVGRDVDPLAFAQLPCVATVGRLPGGHGS